MAKLFQSDVVNVLVYMLVIFFGTGSWIAVNGLWVELPLLVQDLPEGWSLPSYLVAVVQLANIGPLAYTLINRFYKLNDPAVVYLLVVIGTTACMLLAFLWHYTSVVGGVLHSTALLSLAFFLSLVDCTSSVVFLPFMSHLKPQYMTAFYIGEGFSGLIPSVVALAQGVGDIKCVNVTKPTSSPPNNGVVIIQADTQLTPVPEPPLFELNVFFFFLFAMMFLCGLAFVFLNYLPVCRREHVVEVKTTDASSSSSSSAVVATGYRTTTHQLSYQQCETGEIHSNPIHSSVSCDSSLFATGSSEPIHLRNDEEENISVSSFVYLLVLTAWVNAMGNGILPSFQAYSALPYGYTCYHLAVTLSSMANPLMCFVAFMFPTRSKVLVSVLTMLATGLLGYITFLAAMSPNPPLVDQFLGKAIMVVVWIITSAVISCVKVTLATILRSGGKRALLWYGGVTQGGSAVGAMISFVLVTSLQLFKSKAPCS